MSEAGGASPFLYDVYISYADADSDWVEETLIPRLQETGRSVFTEDDLAPGSYELEERTRGVAQSRKTLLILSPAYLDSRWAVLEEAITQDLDPAARKRRLIPVFRDDCDPALRMRPLVAVDLRRGDPPQWRRLLEAVDPSRPEPALSPVRRFSLSLAEATAEIVRPNWNTFGVAYLALTSATGAALLALAYVLLEASSILLYALSVFVGTLSFLLAVLLWREDHDLFRRLSHYVAGSRVAHLGLALGLAATVSAWVFKGYPVARELACGPLGCKEEGKTYLAIDDFVADSPELMPWARKTRLALEHKLSVAPELKVFGLGLASLGGETRQKLKLDYTFLGELEPVPTVYLYDRHMLAAPPEVRLARVGGSGQGTNGKADIDPSREWLEFQNRLATALLERLGVAVSAETAVKLASVPTREPEAAKLNDEAFYLQREGRYEEAEAKLRQAIAIDDGYSVAWSNLGEVAWRTGRYEEALEYRRAAVERLATYAPFHYNLGHLLAYLALDREALPVLEKAVELDPAHASAYNELGKVRHRLGDPRGAVDAFKKGLFVEPDFAPLSKNLGRTLLDAGETAAAAAALERSLTLYPPADFTGRAEATALLVMAAADRDEKAAACRYLEELRELDPESVAPDTPDAENAVQGLPCAGPSFKEDLHA